MTDNIRYTVERVPCTLVFIVRDSKTWARVTRRDAAGVLLSDFPDRASANTVAAHLNRERAARQLDTTAQKR